MGRLVSPRINSLTVVPLICLHVFALNSVPSIPGHTMSRSIEHKHHKHCRANQQQNQETNNHCQPQLA